MKLVDLSYYYSAGCSDPEVLLGRHAPATEYVHYLPHGCQSTVVKFLDHEGHFRKRRCAYHFFHGSSSPFWIPGKAHRFLRHLRPDVVLLHSLLYPVQAAALRRALGPRVSILVQHHGERPGGWWQGSLQRRADAFIDGYLFASPGLALPWLEKGIISRGSKVLTAPEGSAPFTLKSSEEAKARTGVKGAPAFLWVGRLDANKDPLTVLRAFCRYAFLHREARLYMIYGTEDLLGEVKRFIDAHGLREQVVLAGARPHAELEDWYNSADYYLSASHRESYGFSLVEALACGCTPVVSDIPSFRAITGEGRIGCLFPPGDVQGLYEQLCRLAPSVPGGREEAALYFRRHLSYRAMAAAVYAACRRSGGVEVHERAG